MEKELKFKKEWFEILNRCNTQLRTDVIEAVFQYFFTGAEPQFEDEARIIAFGFIRAEIDAARARREKRLARKNANTPQPETPTPTPAPIEPPNYEEKRYLCSLLHHWNTTVEGTDISPIKATLDLDSPEYVPALAALRRLPYNKIYEAVTRVRHRPDKPSFAQFFNSL